MKTLFNTNSKAVNKELREFLPLQRVEKHIPIENRVFAVLGVLLAITIIVNVLVYGIPNI